MLLPNLAEPWKSETLGIFVIIFRLLQDLSLEVYLENIHVKAFSHSGIILVKMLLKSIE